MARGIKLPEELKDWKIISLVSEKKGQNKYRIVKNDGDGEVFANLFHIFAYGKHYSCEKADFFEDEVNFLSSIADKTEYFTCFGAYLYDNPSKEKADMYIATEELEPLSKVMRNKSFSDEEITDFGLQMAEILAFLEERNIFHGNIRPENIFVTKDGRYKLGGFSDFECRATDLDFSAPEVAQDKNPDLTTDIYSVGLIMYCLANDKALPFEGGLVTKAEAVKIRTDGTAVTAPKNGNEKLKSIIVIAIQPENANRWKNAVNMKNALLASCGKLTIEPEKAEESKEEKAVAADNAPVIFEQAESNSENTAEADVKPESENSKTEDNPSVQQSTADTHPSAAPISTDVFDEYEVAKKSGNEEVKTDVEKYGAFFDGIFDIGDGENENAEKSASVKTASKSKTPKQTDNEPEITDDILSKSNTAAKENPHKKGTNAAIIAGSVIFILAVLGFVGLMVYNETFAEKVNNTKPATVDEVTTAKTTQPTTALPTTVKPTEKPTTVPVEKEVISVIGYSYESAKSKLEALGFKVAEGNHLYSTLYSEGYVISQTPDSGTKAKEGTVITLDISLGEEYIEPETYAEESSQSTATENNFIFSNSDSSYISKSDVENLSDSELELALNEIYAKRGWIFTDSELSAYFNSQSWYTPRYTASEFSKNVTFNEYEQANIQLIVNEQKSRGIR